MSNGSIATTAQDWEERKRALNEKQAQLDLQWKKLDADDEVRLMIEVCILTALVALLDEPGTLMLDCLTLLNPSLCSCVYSGGVSRVTVW